MNKPLSEMSLEELWELFPIFLVPHNPEWFNWFKDEEKFLTSIIPHDYLVRIDHIGSSAIREIMSKNIVDVMVVLNSIDLFPTVKKILLDNGYLLMNEEGQRMSFNKGYTPNGFANRVFHIHVRLNDDIDEIYFKNYLITHPVVAKRYEELKKELWHKYEHNRDAYTEGKSEFVKMYTVLAKEKNRV